MLCENAYRLNRFSLLAGADPARCESGGHKHHWGNGTHGEIWSCYSISASYHFVLGRFNFWKFDLDPVGCTRSGTLTSLRKLGVFGNMTLWTHDSLIRSHLRIGFNHDEVLPLLPESLLTARPYLAANNQTNEKLPYIEIFQLKIISKTFENYQIYSFNKNQIGSSKLFEYIKNGRSQGWKKRPKKSIPSKTNPKIK